MSRQLQKEATARAILLAARKIFEEAGFEKANIRDIAKEAGVAPGSVIHHYGDKRILLHSALFEDLEYTLNRALTRNSSGTLETRVSRITKGVFAYYQKRPVLSRVLLKESLFADEPWAQKFSQQTEKVARAIEAMCDEAKEKGEIRKELNSGLFSVSYLSFFYFSLIAWIQGANKSPVPLVENLVSQYIHSFKKRAK